MRRSGCRGNPLRCGGNMPLHTPSDPLCKDLREIKDVGRRSADLTRQLLAFARKQAIAPVVLDLNDMIESLLKMMRRMIGQDIDFVWKPAVKL